MKNRFVKIDPFKREFSIVEQPEDVEFLRFAYEQMECDLIEIVTIGRNDDNGNALDLIIDEEGRFKAEQPDKQAFFGATHHSGRIDVFCGVALVAECNVNDGSTLGLQEPESVRNMLEKTFAFPDEEIVEQVRQRVVSETGFTFVQVK